MKRARVLIISCLIFYFNSYSQEIFDLTIERKMTSNNCTMGYLVADGEVICYTLELPWEDNSNFISCILPGTYNGILRYDKTDGWRIQLEDVPNRTAVQIHIGNYTKDTKGCILVGTGAKTDDCSVQNSILAYSKLKEAFYGTSTPNSTPNKTITISFK